MKSSSAIYLFFPINRLREYRHYYIILFMYSSVFFTKEEKKSYSKKERSDIKKYEAKFNAIIISFNYY